jgi:hypothetical protein
MSISREQRTCGNDNKLPHRFDAHAFLFREKYEDLVGWIVTGRSVEVHFVTTCTPI